MLNLASCSCGRNCQHRYSQSYHSSSIQAAMSPSAQRRSCLEAQQRLGRSAAAATSAHSIHGRFAKAVQYRTGQCLLPIFGGMTTPLTGSSGLLVLLMVAEASLISSIMLVRSFPISSRRSETRPAILYLRHRFSIIYPAKSNTGRLTFARAPDQAPANSHPDQPAAPSSRPLPARTCPTNARARPDGSPQR